MSGSRMGMGIGIIAVGAVLVLAGCGNSNPYPFMVAAPGDAPVTRTVTVTGDAEVLVVPDEVVITLGVETQDRNLERAGMKNDEIMLLLLDLTEGYGIDSGNVKTDYVSIDPEYNYSSSGLDRIVGYRVRKTVVITLGDLSQYDALLADALEIGVNHVHNVDFRTTALRGYRDEARALAIKAAEEKAEALAGELGLRIGDAVTINEHQASVYSWYGYGWGYGWSSMAAQNVSVVASSTAIDLGGTVAPGQISVRAQVTVSFELR